MSLGLPSGHKVTADEFDVAMGNRDGITVSAPSESTTSSSYVDMGGTSSFSFTKKLDATQLLIEMELTFFVTNADTSTRFGVSIDGTDYDVLHMGGNSISSGVNIAGAGSALVASGLDAGTYTIQGRWKRTGGTGSSSRFTNGWLSLHCTESG